MDGQPVAMLVAALLRPRRADRGRTSALLDPDQLSLVGNRYAEQAPAAEAADLLVGLLGEACSATAPDGQALAEDTGW